MTRRASRAFGIALYAVLLVEARSGPKPGSKQASVVRFRLSRSIQRLGVLLGIWLLLGAQPRMGMNPILTEVDGSSVFFEIVVPSARHHPEDSTRMGSFSATRPGSTVEP